MKHLFTAASALLLSISAFAQPTITLTQVATGFSNITTVTNCGDQRLFVLEKIGRIKFVNLYGGTAGTTTFMDIDDRVGGNNSSSTEQGLLGIAFPSDYAASGKFYVNYTNVSGNTIISRFSIVSGNPNAGDPASEEILLTISQPFSNHNGGCIQFGPDGYLYVGMGDGGSGGDPGNRAQNPQLLLGKMLRIRVNTTGPYTIPSDNPFVSPDDGILDEIWATGVRNPWRFSFDRLTGDQWIADVGQNLYEEVDYQPAGSLGGENYGWRCYEGNIPYNASGCTNDTNLTFPVFTYGHGADGCSITGGYVYRGNSYGTIYERYFTTDFCSGRIWTIFPDGSGGFTSNYHGQFVSNAYTTWGEDTYGELYLAQTTRVMRVGTSTGGPLAAISGGNAQNICPGTGGAEIVTGYNPELTYSWFDDGVAIENADSNIYLATVPGNYSVLVSNGVVSTMSDTIIVDFAPAPPIITASAEFDSVCAGSSSTIALTGSEEGGIFSGENVTGNTFNPLQAVAGTFEITYSFTSLEGCASEPASFDIVVNPLPEVTLSAPETLYCVDGGLVSLTTSPAGGELSGPGISGQTFNPATAGIGEHIISYSFTDENSCSQNASFSIEVDACAEIKDIGNVTGITFQPNPFKDQLSFRITDSFNGKATVTLTDMLGKEYYSQVISSDSKSIFEVNLLEGASGIYLLKIETSSGKLFVSKLIRE